jgi:exosortase K
LIERVSEVNMERRSTWTLLTQLSAVVFSAAALKLHYSTANVNDLRWILAPTKILVELATGERFTFESYAGYMNADHTFLIAASCAGVNFLIAAFLMLTLPALWRKRFTCLKWRMVPTAFLIAYLTTITANTVRIAIALGIRRMDLEVAWLSSDQLHRFEGILVYFGFLLLLFIAGQRVYTDDSQRPLGRPAALALPLAVYYATTLGIPIVNGLYRRDLEIAALWEHFFFVLVTPMFLLAPLSAYHIVKVSSSRYRLRSAAG